MMINPVANALATNKAVAATPTSSSSSSSDPLANNTSDLFLQLLVTQLKTQDPTSPMDPTEMVGQMLSMNQLNELIQIQQLLQGAFSPSQTTTPQTTTPTTGG